MNLKTANRKFRKLLGVLVATVMILSSVFGGVAEAVYPNGAEEHEHAAATVGAII